MTDLFISYSSHDELWVKKFFFDFTSRFPTIKPFWARDTAAIPPGDPFRPIFEGAAQNATHFIVFWSAAAQTSNEVGPEIQAFLQNVQGKPKSDTGATRRLFYVPLQTGVDYGGLVNIQGFPDFRPIYKARTETADTGISGLDTDQFRGLWHRMVGAVGHKILDDQGSQPITLALLVMTNTNKGKIDQVLNDDSYSRPTLSELLQCLGLTLEEVKPRYGDTAMAWRPFGTDKTIIDLMQDVREAVNSHLGEAARFHWVPMDFVEEMRTAPDPAARDRVIQSLLTGPSVVIIDPISLYHGNVNFVFRRYLNDYAKKPQSIILSIAPKELQAAEHLYSSLSNTTHPLLEGYLSPQIPSADPFALCGMNVQHAVDVVRLVRSGLGYYYLQKKKAALQPLVASGV